MDVVISSQIRVGQLWMIKIGRNGWFTIIRDALKILTEDKRTVRVLYVVRMTMNIIWVSADFVYLVVDPIIVMEGRFLLIKIGQIGKVYMIISAMDRQPIEEVMEVSVFAAIIQFAFCV